MSCNSHPEIVQRYLSWATVTSTSRTTPSLPRCTTSWPSSTQKSTPTSSITLRVSTRQACTWRPKRWLSKLRTKSIRRRCSSFKSPFSMNSRRSLTQRLWSRNSHLTRLSTSSHKAACCTRRRSTRLEDRSFKKLWIWLDTNAISLTISHFATTRWSN